MPVQPVHTFRISYGKAALKQSIANVLNTVLEQYNYTSLEHLNAVLKLYNLRAEKGEPGSRLNRYHGLQYQVLNEQGEKIGVPIKASSFHSHPTLSFLENKFEKNAAVRTKTIQRTRQVMAWILQRSYGSLEALAAAAEKEGIRLIRRQGRDDVLYGITYVDIKSKLVVNGSELGKQYSAKGILEKLGLIQQHMSTESTLPVSQQPIAQPSSRPAPLASSFSNNSQGLLEQIILPEDERDEVVYPLQKKKRKKKRRGG